MTLSREEAVQRYGAIDPVSGYWPNKDRFMTMLEIPSTWFPDWHVMGTKAQVKHIACNVDMKDPLFAALSQIRLRGLGSGLHTFDGCFNVRYSRGLHLISAHAWGLAIDLNAMENPLGSLTGGFFDMLEFVDVFKQFGFTWGGDFKTRKDSQHFSLVGF